MMALGKQSQFWPGVSSLGLGVSSRKDRAAGLPTSNFTLQTSNSLRAKQSQFSGQMDSGRGPAWGQGHPGGTRFRQGLAQSQVAGDRQYQNATLVHRERQPDLIIEPCHNHFSAPQPLLLNPLSLDAHIISQACPPMQENMVGVCITLCSASVYSEIRSRQKRGSRGPARAASRPRGPCPEGGHSMPRRVCTVVAGDLGNLFDGRPELDYTTILRSLSWRRAGAKQRGHQNPGPSNSQRWRSCSATAVKENR